LTHREALVNDGGSGAAMAVGCEAIVGPVGGSPRRQIGAVVRPRGFGDDHDGGQWRGFGGAARPQAPWVWSKSKSDALSSPEARLLYRLPRPMRRGSGSADPPLAL